MLDSITFEPPSHSAWASSNFRRVRRFGTAGVCADAPSKSASQINQPDSSRVVQRSLSNGAGGQANGTPSSSIASSEFLAAADLSRYVAIFRRLTELEADHDGDVRFDASAIATARAILGGLVVAKWAPPRLTWQDGEAVIFYWSTGDTVFAFTVTDGELGYVETRGDIITKRGSSIPIDQATTFEFLFHQ